MNITAAANAIFLEANIFTDLYRKTPEIYRKNALKIKPTHIGNLKRNIGIRAIGYIGPFHISTISADEKYPDNKFFA